MKHLATLLLFACAMPAYIAGSMPGTAALLIVAVVLESLGWRRVFRINKRQPLPVR